jgi:hypothetical protein
MDRAYPRVIPVLVAVLSVCWAVGFSGDEPDTLWRRSLDWFVSFGGVQSDAGNGILGTPDGGFLACGVTNSYGEGFCDVYVVKVDSQGKLQWEKYYGGGRSDYANAMCHVDGEGYMVVGSTWSLGNGEADAYLLKIDEEGNEQWSRTFGGPYYERASSVQQTDDGGFIVAGWTTSFGNGGVDMFLLKVDANGNEQWRNTYGGDGDDFCHAVGLTRDGGFIASGNALALGSSRTDASVIKTNGKGEVEWSRRFGGSGDEYGRSIIQTGDGGYVLAGHTSSFGSGGPDVYFVRMDSIGDTLWTRAFGGEGTDGCAAIVSSANGGFAATGWTNSFGAGEFDIYFMEIDSSGVLVRTNTFGWRSRERSNAMVGLEDGGFAITGFALSSETGYADLFILKLFP